MDIFSIIPARGGSKGVPGKNIRSLSGHPLLAYSIQVSKSIPEIRRTIVSTDSEEIAEVARAYGAEVPFLRPASIAGDRSTDYEFFAHAVDWFMTNEGKTPDAWVHLRPTSPLRDPEIVAKGIQTFIATPHCSALRSVNVMSETAYKSFEIEAGCLKAVGSGSFAIDSSNSARQSFPATYYANGYVDLVRSSLIREEKKIHGNRVAAFVTPPIVEIDTLEDLEYLEFQANQSNPIVRRLFGER